VELLRHSSISLNETTLKRNGGKDLHPRFFFFYPSFLLVLVFMCMALFFPSLFFGPNATSKDGAQTKE
jgi:hypothetical protein